MNEMPEDFNVWKYLPPPENFRPGSGNYRVYKRLATFGRVTTKEVHALGADMSRVADCKKAMKKHNYTLPKGGIRIAEDNYEFPLIPLEG